jgi:hypothetical protein
VFIDEPSKLDPPGLAKYDKDQRGYRIPYTAASRQPMLIREYELFANTNDQPNAPDFERRRLLYSHLINI